MHRPVSLAQKALAWCADFEMCLKMKVGIGSHELLRL
jgi:hypothetical protein